MMLSISMIVKNEESNLPRCLESIKPLHAELIVVDTGSVDQTIRIAKDYGAKVYQHPWENNFSKHRNQSFSYASGKWILQIDADEKLMFPSGMPPSMFYDFLEHIRPDMNAIALQASDIFDNKQVTSTLLTRLFRNGRVKFERAIHNEPMYKGPTGIMPYIKLLHYGYDLEPHQRINKAKRTIGLLKQELKNNPKDYDSMFYISQAYSTFADDTESGVKWAIKYANCRNKIKKKHFRASIYWSLAAHYINNKNPKEAWKWLQIGMKDFPGDLDISMGILKYGILIKNQNLIGVGARAFVNAYHEFDKNLADIGSRFIFNHTPESYAFALFHLTITYLEHAAQNMTLLKNASKNISIDASNDISDTMNHWFEKNDAIFKHYNTMFPSAKAA